MGLNERAAVLPVGGSAVTEVENPYSQGEVARDALVARAGCAQGGLSGRSDCLPATPPGVRAVIITAGHRRPQTGRFKP